MSDDRMMAELLGDGPRAPDPGFRFDVFVRIAARARKRAAMRRAAKVAGLFAAIGLAFPLAGAAGLSLADARPFLLVASVLCAAYVFALFAIEGPSGVLARSRALVRA